MPSNKPPADVHQQDHHARDRIAADEPARTVHRSEEVSLAIDQIAPPVGLVLVDEPGVQVGVDRHLPPGKSVQRESCRHFADSGRPLSDHDKLDHDHDREQDHPHDHLVAGHERAERTNHLTRCVHALFAPPGQHQASRRHVQHQPGERGGQEDRRGPASWRVAVIGTGHLSLELGGPRQFGEHGPDPAFDAQAVEWIGNGDIDGCLANVTLDSLHSPGNATHGFMDFMLMMGVAGYNKADYVDNLDLFHTMEAYFTWYPNGLPAAEGTSA